MSDQVAGWFLVVAIPLLVTVLVFLWRLDRQERRDHARDE